MSDDVTEPKQPTDDAPAQPDTVTPPETGGDGPGQQPAPEAAFTQADVDRIVKERLEREKAKAQEREQKAREEAERKAAEEQGKFKELYEQAQARIEQEEKARKALELKMLRQQVAKQVGIPDALADRLVGETQEELEADAKQLLETLPKADPKAPSLNGGAGGKNRGPGTPIPSLEEMKEMAAVYGVTVDSLKKVYGVE